MKIAVIYGNERRSSTYQLAQMAVRRLAKGPEEVTEFFLPKALPEFCLGCANCFLRGEKACPHAGWVAPIQKSLEEADLMIFAAPVYAMRTTGQMKTLLDHLAFLHLVHRPRGSMFRKMALILSTAAGAGTRSANRDLLASLGFWGVARVYSYGTAVHAYGWDHVDGRTKVRLEREMGRLCGKILRQSARVTPRLSVKAKFHLFRLMMKVRPLSQVDQQYWREKGWLDEKRPWKPLV